MFICNDCLKERFANWGSLSKSWGHCEFCKRTRVCYDIPSDQLIAKAKVPDPASIEYKPEVAANYIAHLEAVNHDQGKALDEYETSLLNTKSDDMPGRRMKIGVVGVDSGQLVITDPYYIDHGGEQCQLNDPEALCHVREQTAPEGQPKDLNHAKKFAQLRFDKGHDGLGVVFNSGMGDGTYEVWATIRECGDWGDRVTKVEVILVEEDAFCPKCTTYLNYDIDNPYGQGFCPDCGWNKASTSSDKEPEK